MQIVWEAIAAMLFAGGLFFLLVGTVGLLRLPDAYCRLHATTKCDTMGAGLVLLSLAIRSPWPTAAKLGLIIVFILITNPTAAHVIARAAYMTGHRPRGSGSGEGGGG